MKNQQDVLKQFLIKNAASLKIDKTTERYKVHDLMKISLKLLVPGPYSTRSFVYKIMIAERNELALFDGKLPLVSFWSKWVDIQGRDVHEQPIIMGLCPLPCRNLFICLFDF